MTAPPPPATTLPPATARDDLRAFVTAWVHNADCGHTLPPRFAARLERLIDAVEDAARGCTCQTKESRS